MEQIIEIIVRSALAFLLMMIVTRTLGKATISQMTYHDFVAAITLGALTANIAFNVKMSIWPLIVSLATFSGIAYILLVLVLKNRKMRKWISGQPAILIQDGKILEHNMQRLKFTLDSLNQELREKNIFNIEEVEYAVLELNGKVSALLKQEYLPVTRKDLKLQPNVKQSFPLELIMDGEIVEDNLSSIRMKREWLIAEIKRRGLSLQEVNYAVKSSNGQLYFDCYQDGIKRPIDEV